MRSIHKARVAALAVGTAAVMAAGASAASASTTLRSGSTTGPPVSGPIIGPLSGTATLNTAFGVTTCTTGSLGGTVVAPNPSSTSVVLSSPILTLGTVGGTSCTGPSASNAPFRIFDASLTSAASVNVLANAAGTGGTLTATTVVVRLRIASPKTLTAPNGSCDFAINTAQGAAVNSDNSVMFFAVPITSATGLCGQWINSSSNFSAKFGPMQSGGADVFVTQ